MVGKEGQKRKDGMKKGEEEQKIIDARWGHGGVRVEERWVTCTHNLLKEMLTVWRLLGGGW